MCEASLCKLSRVPGDKVSLCRSYLQGEGQLETILITNLKR